MPEDLLDDAATPLWPAVRPLLAAVLVALALSGIALTALF